MSSRMPTYKEQNILDKVCKVTRQKQIKFYNFIPFFDFQLSALPLFTLLRGPCRISPEYDFPQASQARVASMYEEELDLQHPLFSVHGYDEKKVSIESNFYSTVQFLVNKIRIMIQFWYHEYYLVNKSFESHVHLAAQNAKLKCFKR